MWTLWQGRRGVSKSPYYYISLGLCSKMAQKGGWGQKCPKKLFTWFMDDPYSKVKHFGHNPRFRIRKFKTDFYTYFRRAVVDILKMKLGNYGKVHVPISMFRLFGKIVNGNKIQNSINAFTVLYYWNSNDRWIVLHFCV